MTLATHIAPEVSIPLAMVCAAMMLWYWRFLGRPSVPHSRRRIRRASLLLMMTAAIVFVYAASFADDQRDPQAYAIAWALFIILLLIVVLIALLDVFNNLRIARDDRARMTADARARLMKAASEARNGFAGRAADREEPA